MTFAERIKRFIINTLLLGLLSISAFSFPNLSFGDTLATPPMEFTFCQQQVNVNSHQNLPVRCRTAYVSDDARARVQVRTIQSCKVVEGFYKARRRARPASHICLND